MGYWLLTCPPDGSSLTSNRFSSFVFRAKFFLCTGKFAGVRARQFFFCFAYAKIRHERGGLQIKCQKRHAKKHAHNFGVVKWIQNTEYSFLMSTKKYGNKNFIIYII